MRKGKKQNGFIAITSTLIVSTLILILSINMFHTALTSQSISYSYDSGEQASALAGACIREAFFRVKEDIDYAGDETISINGINCNIGRVEDTNNHTKTISALVRIGDRSHFKRSESEIRYIVESKAENWACEDCVIQGLETNENSLILPTAFIEEEGEFVPVESSGSRISAELDISGQGTVKNSQIFWQADTRFSAPILVEVRFYNGEVWTDWGLAVSRKEVPWLGSGTNLEAALVQTRSSFAGGPDFYPSLKNINLFIEIEK